jgi:hypothetical protein
MTDGVPFFALAVDDEADVEVLTREDIGKGAIYGSARKVSMSYPSTQHHLPTGIMSRLGYEMNAASIPKEGFRDERSWVPGSHRTTALLPVLLGNEHM